MAGNIIELHIEVPADLESNVFGQFDEHLKLIERTLNVTVISRDGILKILGNEQSASSAKKLIEELVVLAKRGNTITRQNINYALSLAMEQRNEVLTEIDKDFICNTIQGRPIKPKTLGQKDYVEQIRKKMIVFGVGPAGTGKTYLAMAMAVTAFRNEEVSRIILTRPAIEAGEKLGEVLAQVEVHTPVIPYIANVTAGYVTDAGDVKPLLIKQVSSSVRWEQSIRRMLEDGVDTFIEIGPGRTLTGFMKKIDRNAKAMNIEKLEDIEKVKEALGC